jgi:hypothetical protein
MSDEKPSFTDAQVARQISKCREAIFDNYSELSDTEYKGDVKQEVKDIFSDSIVIDEMLNETEFQTMFQSCVDRISDWLLDNTRGVHQMVSTFFSADFVSQTLGSSYSVHEVDEPSSDPMFG